MTELTVLEAEVQGQDVGRLVCRAIPLPGL